MSEVKLYNQIYELTHEYEDLWLPLSGAIVGWMNAGIPGALIGCALGITDVTAIHYRWSNKPYLTYGMLGYGMTHGLPIGYHIGDALGFACGLLMPTGLFNDYLNRAVVPGSAAIYGYSYAGSYGAAFGFGGGIIDEILSSHNITHQNYFTNAVYGLALAKLALPLPLPPKIDIALKNNRFIKECVGSAVFLLYAYNVQVQDMKSAITEIKSRLYSFYSELIPEEELNRLIIKQSITLITAQLIIQRLSLNLIGHQQNVRNDLEKFAGANEQAWRPFTSSYKGLTLFLAPYFVGHWVEEFINKYFSARLRYLARDSSRKKWLTGESPLKLEQYKSVNGTDPNVLLKNMYEDTSIVTVQGSALLTSGLCVIVKGVYSASFLISTNAQDVIIYSLFYNEIAGFMTRFLATKQSSSANELKVIGANVVSATEHARVNADCMVQVDATEFVENKLTISIDAYRTLEISQMLWGIWSKSWEDLKRLTDFLFTYMVIAWQIHTKVIQFTQRLKALWAVEGISEIAAWSSKNTGAMILVNQALVRLIELNRGFEDVASTTQRELNRVYFTSNTSKICLHNFSVKVENITLVHTNDLCIESKITGITGASGSGKTAAMKILKGIDYSGIYGEGHIEYHTLRGNTPVIMLSSQHRYIPPYCNLLELITLKVDSEARLYEERVKSLLVEINIDSNIDAGLVLELHKYDDWEKRLSGGQGQKIVILRSILKGPDILILDEIFDGLDDVSIINIQRMLLKYLPNTMLLIVDHKVGSNNLTGFYDSLIYFNNLTKTIELASMPFEPFVPELIQEHQYSTDELAGEACDGVSYDNMCHL